MRGRRDPGTLGPLLNGWPLVVIGVVVAVAGLAGVLGRLDRTRFALDRRDGEPTRRRHVLLQRLGGGMFVLVGVGFVIAGANDL
ncbi:hypothetical protein [Cellulomonas sp. PS-H5]|uniref:hypothetical protein n=1 Tax=Cellulomonas sp. PS-H5 TaxID=2820400 RepID=UPI001C4F52A1|nr:hypothetical protein [Cellulomonas sp. PS-H5]MBW0252940.1 hypothetical protein [Cellulomonas sp. PS-H5]